MNLTYTTQQIAFRAEVRAWLAAHVPAAPLEHYDASRAGFEAHRAWERTLKSGDWGNGHLACHVWRPRRGPDPVADF